jgi:hypothetical protein
MWNKFCISSHVDGTLSHAKKLSVYKFTRKQTLLTYTLEVKTNILIKTKSMEVPMTFNNLTNLNKIYLS